MSGAYNVSIAPAEIDFWSTDFSSDAGGLLGGGWFDAVTVGGDSWHFDNDFADESFFEAAAGGSAGFFQTHTSGVGSIIPEPSTALLLGGGLIGLAARRRRVH